MSIALEPETETRLPDRYEVINGDIVELPPMSWLSSEVANQIRDKLAAYCETHQIGRTRNDMLFEVPLPKDRGRNRRPDVAFISFNRWAADRPLPYRGNPATAVPELVVEVVSPTDDAEDLIAKAHEYLEAGVKLVWLVYPRSQTLYAYDSVSSVRIFNVADDLNGGSLLPGFQVPMSQLFPPMIPDPELSRSDDDE
ncbi:MAG TPA: Uma2 family endonuclease [Gemmataceae bacterium]|jgi:Uma2 family endonuclease|nr:Uma2 family endonuclease [Gemmataceae bacterium]